ncbi:hypothetical protein CHH62_00115 [Niallia circulans]|uniref:MupG family TIM beta-alpha barrel fold protein n=1 Tax=Niallia circulans TaxID=1397 RepID=UPI000BA76348|nr:MupG family TIM beta-alpha barrel fold protein [Niallia circulans]PAD27501.1 hypothetical protein CHH62_00115 [Niallia circulans]
MIGISFYLKDPFAEERIIRAGKLGVKRAFTSLHIPEESGELATRAKALMTLAAEAGIEVFADVSLKTPSHLGLNSLMELKKLGVIGLRLDDGFDNEMILTLSKAFKLALNASTFQEEDLSALIKAGLNANQLIAWHNFYPRQETGLSISFFQSQNEIFQRFGIPISAYIPGDKEKRGPLFDGLPTLENHRHLKPYHAALELFLAGVEDVYIGDYGVSEALLHKLIDFDQHHYVSIRIQGYQEGEFQLRPDFSRDVLRFLDTRSLENIYPENTEARPAGTITRDNDLYGRYRGEIQITLCDLPADERVNVIGKVVDTDIPLLSLLKPSQKIKLVPVYS